jgi:predicted nucleic acid-binding protein
VKLLVDTSVWSLALRRKHNVGLSPEEQKLKAELIQAIQDGRVAMLGILRQELLSGIKEKDQFDKVKAALDPFLDEPTNTADHVHAARLYNECRNQGIEAGTVDILICAVAARRSWKVLSGDARLNRCLAVTKKFHLKQSRIVAEEVKTRRTARS